MFESLAALAVRRPVAVSVVALAVALVGWLSWQQLPVDLLPDVETPTVVVSVRSGDRPPAEMERLYGERVEQLLFSVRGIRNVEQVARSGRLVATVEFDWESDVDLGLIDVQKAVGQIEADPQVDEVLVRRFDPRQAPILSLGLVAPSGQPDLAELRRLARRQVAPGLERLPGVAEVRVVGGREREVRIVVDRYRLDAYGVSLSQLEGRLAQENVDIGVGTLEEENRIFQLRALSRFRRIEDVGNVVVRYLRDDSGRHQAVRVSDIGNVELVDREIDHLVRVDGTEGVGLSIYKEAGANTVAVSTTVRDALGGLDDDLPNVDVREITDDASVVVDALDRLKTAAGVGVVLAIAVLAAFLRSAGAVLIVAAAVPVSLFAALFFMGFGSYSLNIVTLGGLALGAGMLVDNAIVVVESIYRRLAAGDAPGPAAARGTGEVAGAITASTLTTCVVFLPVLFVQGLAARLIDGIAFTVTISLIASLGVALFLIPALSRWFLRGPRHEAQPSPARRALESFVAKLLRRPFAVILIAATAAVAATVALLRLGTELMPPADPRQFSIRLVGPSSQRVESTARVVAGVEDLLRQAGGDSLAATLSEVGRLPEDDRLIRSELAEENTARVIARMDIEGPTGRQVANWLGAELANLPATEVSWEIGRSALTDALGTTGPPITVEVSGNALEDLRRGADRIKQRLEMLPELWNIRSSFEGGPPELRVTLDRAMADALGVNLNTMSRVLEASLDGRVATILSTGDEERRVTIRLPTPRREDLGDVVFRAEDGRLAAIGQVATFAEEQGAREIFRRDQRRTAEVTAQIAEGVSQPAAIAAVRAALDDLPLPPGTRSALRGEEEQRARTFTELRLAGVLALVLVFMVLAGTFESLVQPVTVLSAIPLALIGVASLLVWTGQPIGVMAMLGLIVLAGIAVNDAVLLIATARQQMAEGRDRIDALATAAGIRLRPIAMTTLTTALALVPLVLAGGEGASLRAPMALTIIGGIAASTVGSLLVLPCVYLVLDRTSSRLRRSSA